MPKCASMHDVLTKQKHKSNIYNMHDAKKAVAVL